MSSFKAIFVRASRLAIFLLLSAAGAIHAGSITNVSVVNVTPSSFSLVWRGIVEDSSAVQIFADAGGQTNITSALGVELYPLHTGNPNYLEGYERRQSRADLRARTKSLGLVQAKVRNGVPGSTYYFKITSSTGGSTNSYPTSGVAAVQLPPENSFVLNSQQLIIGLPGVDHSGQIVTLSHTNGAYALAAVVGDGTGTNQVFFNLNDIFAITGGNLAPTGPQEFFATILGPPQSDEQQVFSVAFTEGFSVGGANSGTTAEDFLVVNIGSGVFRTGETNELAIDINSSPISEFSMNIALPEGRFDKLALKAARGQVDPASLSIIKGVGTNYALSFRAAAGTSITGQGAAVTLSFISTNHTSAFVPVRPTGIVARKADQSALPLQFATAGRMVLVGNEPLVEATIEPTGRKLTLYGKPWSSFEIQGANGVGAGVQWNLVARVPMTNLVYSLENLNSNDRTQFFRALEFVADPPLLELTATGPSTSKLRVFGRAGNTYSVQYTTNLSGVVQWNPLLNYTLTNSFGNISNLETTNKIRVYRVTR